MRSRIVRSWRNETQATMVGPTLPTSVEQIGTITIKRKFAGVSQGALDFYLRSRAKNN